MKFKWITPKHTESSYFEQIKKERNIHEDYFYSSLKDIPNLSLMKDLEKAAKRIIKALKHKERIMIFGDDDIDGVTSTYIIFDYFSKLGFQDHYAYIPNRLLESHGMQEGFIEEVKKRNIDLVITVDGGVSCLEQVDTLNELGCDVIITDHHEVPERLPNAYAIIDSKQKDCEYPYKMLAGVGVTYFLIKKIAELINTVTEPSYLFWVAVGTIADRVPLDGVNRILVKEVIENWYEFDDETLDVLNKYLWFPGDFSSRMAIIRYLIKLLANGRESEGENAAFRLLTTPKQYKGLILKSLLNKRKENEKQLVKIRQYLDTIMPAEEDFYYLHYDKDNLIPHQYLGLCASSISKLYLMPTVFLKKRDELIICEVRGIDGFNFINAFESMQDLLIQWGGHQKAAGFSMEEKNLDKFKEAFGNYAQNCKQEILNNRQLKIDCIIKPSEINELLSFIQVELPSFQPFGEGNPEPLFLIQGYCWQRDNAQLSFNEDNMIHDDNEYDIVFNFRGSSFYILDYHKSQKDN